MPQIRLLMSWLQDCDGGFHSVHVVGPGLGICLWPEDGYAYRSAAADTVRTLTLSLLGANPNLS